MRNEPRAFAKKGPLRIAVMAIRRGVVRLQLWFLRRILGMNIGNNVGVSLRAKLDFTNPGGVHIGDSTYIAFGAVIFTHDMTRLWHTNTYVGSYCFIGANSIIMPGVRVGDHCIVGSGAVVTRDVPERSIVVGNPAQVIRSNIETDHWGILKEAIEDVQAMKAKTHSSSG